MDSTFIVKSGMMLQESFTHFKAHWVACAKATLARREGGENGPYRKMPKGRPGGGAVASVCRWGGTPTQNLEVDW